MSQDRHRVRTHTDINGHGYDYGRMYEYYHSDCQLFRWKLGSGRTGFGEQVGGQGVDELSLD
jgi:hypothetical protein